MDLRLIRTYYPDGTNGTLFHEKERVCFTIELPWLNNVRKVSCIPEGRYELRKRYSQHLGWHLHLLNVPQRDIILVHPANDALKELKGCIAPVLSLTGHGKGVNSRAANDRLKGLIFEALERRERVYLQIQAGEALK